MKNNSYGWLWKWHFIAGIVSIPIVIMLSVTGIIYLFKDNYEKPILQQYQQVEVQPNRLTYQEQIQKVIAFAGKAPQAMVIPANPNNATEFTTGRFSHKKSVFVNPFSGEVTGSFSPKDTKMHKVRKLHGELLLGKFGTKIVELIASWMVILILTGLYLFWPRGRGLKGFFTVRTTTKRILFRDLHALSGFWFSLVLLLILFGGLPWTDVFGSSFKWVQNQTNTGFPATWQGRMFQSNVNGAPLSLDQMITKAKELNLEGNVSIGLPRGEKGIYSVSNAKSGLKAMHMVHFDQYSGEILHTNTWKDIGVMMRSRLWLMAFHQGQFGLWNLILVVITALGLILMSVTAILSYLKRKKEGSLTIPYKNTKASTAMVVLVILLGVLLPMFGFSIIAIFLFTHIVKLIPKIS